MKGFQSSLWMGRFNWQWPGVPIELHWAACTYMPGDLRKAPGVFAMCSQSSCLPGKKCLSNEMKKKWIYSICISLCSLLKLGTVYHSYWVHWTEPKIWDFVLHSAFNTGYFFACMMSAEEKQLNKYINSHHIMSQFIQSILELRYEKRCGWVTWQTACDTAPSIALSNMGTVYLSAFRLCLITSLWFCPPPKLPEPSQC